MRSVGQDGQTGLSLSRMGKDLLEYVAEDLVMRRLRGATGNRECLLCFPPAGGSSIFFKLLAQHLSDDWNVWAIDPPGHGLAKGVPLESVESMAGYYFQKLQAFFQGRFYLLGHSLGGLVVHTLARKLEAIGVSAEAVIICGTRPPHRIQEGPSFSTMSDEELLQFLIQMNGIPEEIAADRRMVELFLPSIRSDLRAVGTFRIDPERDKLHCQVWLFAGKDDPFAKITQIGEWSQYCSEIRLVTLPGDHFFVQSHAAELADRLQDLATFWLPEGTVMPSSER